MFTPPRYAARYDWEYKALHPGGNVTEGWVIQIFHLVSWRQSMLPTEAWNKLALPPATARSALTTLPVRLTFGSAGIVPPDTARRMFARSVAKSIDSEDDYPDLALDPDITSFTTEERSFKPPRYMPRPDWREKLESFDPEDGSWQADLLKYWRLRLSGRKEKDAWAEVNMSVANAKLALIKDEPTPDNDSGLIPFVPKGKYKDTVARRVFARSVAKNIDATDIYNDLILDEPQWF